MFTEHLEQFIDRINAWVRPSVRVFGRSRSAFHVCGFTGLASSVALALTLAAYRQLSLWVVALLILSAMATFLALAMATKILVSVETLIYYHHEIAVLAVAAVLLRLSGLPALPYLDVLLLGIGMFLACGRVGCTMVGCCHGGPHRWGVRYREEHAAAGFPAYLVGVRLFPIQIIEALCVFVTVVVGSALVLGGGAPGEALAWYTISYGAVRFYFEFVRGDPARPYRWGFSEAQWISLTLMWAVVWAELSGALVSHAWHVAAAAAVAATVVVVAARRRLSRTQTHQLLHPRHVREVAETIDELSRRAAEAVSAGPPGSAPAVTHIGRTSRGVQITAGVIPDPGGWIHHYALSRAGGELTEEAAAALAKLILQLRYDSASCEVVRGGEAVYHVLVRPRGGPGGGVSPRLKFFMQESHHAL